VTKFALEAVAMTAQEKHYLMEANGMKIKLATASMNVAYDKQANLKKFLSLIDEAASFGADLLVLPEQSLQGYLPSMTALDMSHYQYQYDNAETIPDGASVRAVVDKAMERNIYVVFGMTEKDAYIDYKLYNSAVLTGPDGYIGKYRKVHLPLDELHTYYAGEDFPVFQTKIGRIGMLICYDKAFPESAREAALADAEILVTPLAWPHSTQEHISDPEKDPNLEEHRLYDRVRAMENQIFFISSNHAGASGKAHYLGNSNIVGPNGVIIATTGYNEGVAYAEVDLKQEIYRGKTIGMGGSNLMRERRPSVYKNLRDD